MILISIILLGLFLRFYKLEDYPVQLNHDEVSQIYDAISIAKTGKDIYGNFMPVIFESVNDFKSPFYTYITAIFYLIFGGGEIIIRLPGAIFGVLIILAIYFFTEKVFKIKKIALLAAFFSSIAPFELFFSRKSFENVAGIFFMLVGFTFLLTFFQKKKIIWLYAGTISLAVAMYTYFSHAILIPILLIIFLFIFQSQFKKLQLSAWLKPLLFWIVLISPLMFIIATNPETRYRSERVFIKQDVNLGERISQVQTGNTLIDSFSSLKITADYSFNRFLSQFDSIYVFGNGLDFTNQGPLGMGLLLLIQVPFLIAGMVFLAQRSEITKEKKFILAWIIIGMLPSGLTFEPYSPHRSIMVFTMLNIISASGLYFFIDSLKNLRIKLFRIKLFVVAAVSAIFIFNFVYFYHMYTVNFPYEKFQHLHYPFEQVARFAWSEYPNFDHIVFDPLYGETAPVIGTAAHYYIGYFGNYPPEKMQMEYRRGAKEREVIFDKFSIRKVDWGTDKNLQNTLIIASIWSLPKEVDKGKIIKTIYYYDGKPAFYAVSLK